MKCPICAAPCGDDAAECPACGLIFAKWRERQEKEKREALEAQKELEASPKRVVPANPWIGRCIAAAMVAAWLLFLCFYMIKRARKGSEQIGVDTGVSVEVRDPKTGETRRLPIRRVEAR
jgi:hypothetical protein